MEEVLKKVTREEIYQTTGIQFMPINTLYQLFAAQRDTSISGLLTQQLEELTAKNDSYEQAKTRALARLRSGFGFHGIEHMTREEIHDRKASREPWTDE